MSINIVKDGELKNISGINFDELSAVAKTGSYEDLLNKPDIPTKATDIGAAIGDANGVATSAAKLNANAGSATKPVYFVNGVPVAGSYTLGEACAKGVATTVASGNTNLVTSGAVYTALQSAGGASVEMGTWSPSVVLQNSSVGYMYPLQNYYVRVGSIVFLHGGFSDLSGGQAGSGYVKSIGNLPFISMIYGNSSTSNGLISLYDDSTHLISGYVGKLLSEYNGSNTITFNDKPPTYQKSYTLHGWYMTDYYG